MSDGSPRNGGDLLVEVLRALDVDAAFGVVSVHNLPLVDALTHQLRWVPTRSEAAAVNAADGYARVRGTPGCAVTSTGTGAANAAGALVEALTAASPVLHVTGQIPSEYLGCGRGVIHETRNQLGMLQACSVWAATVEADASGAFTAAARRLGRQALGPPPARPGQPRVAGRPAVRRTGLVRGRRERRSVELAEFARSART